MSGFTLPWSRRILNRVVRVISAAQGVSEEAKQWYLDDLESGFEPEAYANMADEGIIQDLHDYLAALDRTA